MQEKKHQLSQRNLQLKELFDLKIKEIHQQ